jgi:hypothetical protein
MVAFRSSVRSSNHHWVCIEPRDDSSMPSKFRCEFTVTTTNFEQCFAGITPRVAQKAIVAPARQ